MMKRRLFLLLAVVFFMTPMWALAQQKEVNIKILSSSFGGMSYRLSFGLAEIINKNHPYIRAVARETRGSTENQMTMQRHPEMKEDTIFNCNDLSYHRAVNAMAPFKSPYTSGRVIIKFMDVIPILFTLDKNIRTKEDLAGKRLVTLGAQHTISQMFEMVIKDVWGMGDKVKIMRGQGFEDAIDSVRDGIADFGTSSLNTIFGTGKFAAVPALRELMQMKDVYFINLSEEDVKALSRKGGGLPIVYQEVPAGAIAKRQVTAGASYGHSNEWWADAAMDENIVYEITKLVYEHAADFKTYHGLAKLWDPDKLYDTPLPEKLYHPGALKFYREKGFMK